MHVLLIADGRSPHTLGWVRGMGRLGLTTTLLSSRLLDAGQFAAFEGLLGADHVVQPRDLWNRAVRPHLTPGSVARRALARGRDAPAAPAGPRPEPALVSRVELYAARRLGARLHAVVRRTRPDAVHALRVQYEAIAAALADPRLPVAVSTWGQDLVSTAGSNRILERGTRAALHRADLLFSDCERDADLAAAWGLRPGTPRHVVPGNFGVDTERFPHPDPMLVERMGLAGPLVTYPRGVRAFVNHRGFVAAARSLVAEGVTASFVGVGLADAVDADDEIPGVLHCTPALDHARMLELAAASAVTVSPAWSDGMPNSVLEGMAGGTIPVCGDIGSLRELERRGAVVAWCDPSDPWSIASAIRTALRLAADPANRARNATVVARHYSVPAALLAAESAYHDLESLLDRPVVVRGAGDVTGGRARKVAE